MMGSKENFPLAHSLNDSEREHFLDCPQAELPQRLASTLLDFILFSLAVTALRHLFEMGEGIIHFTFAWAGIERLQMLLQLTQYAANVCKVLVAYFFFIWSGFKLGGTPGKLLLGLRLIDASGNSPRPLTVLLREVVGKPLAALWMLGPYWVLRKLKKRKTMLHDQIFKTSVRRVRGEL